MTTTTDRRPPGHRPSRRRGSEIRRLIADLKELTRAVESLRREDADAGALAAKRNEIERKQSQLAHAVRRDPTFAGG